ncbi:hypothetical protein ACOSQ3_013410 [Xanthoceras sorbifolium]
MKIIGKGKINVPDLGVIDDAVLVEGLRGILLSVTHLCEQVGSVVFRGNKCQIFDKHDDILVEGLKASNNCFYLDLDVPNMYLNALERYFLKIHRADAVVAEQLACLKVKKITKTRLYDANGRKLKKAKVNVPIKLDLVDNAQTENLHDCDASFDPFMDDSEKLDETELE